MKKFLLPILLSSLISSSFATCFDNLKVGENFNKVSVPTDKVVFQQTKEKVLLTEFFWYGCPHCYSMEPMIKDYLKKNPNVEFKRYPLAYPNWASGSAYFFTEEQLGLFDKLHQKSFDKIHKEHVDILNDKNEREKFLKAEGVDVAKFEETLKSFNINMKLKKGLEDAKNYKLTSAPSFVINNTYVVDPGLGKGYEGTIKNIDTIIKSVSDKTCSIK